MIDVEDVSKYDKVFVVVFYDGYVDGSKYDVESLNTKYMSFTASVGTKFFRTDDEAFALAEKLNNKKGK